MTMTKLSTNSGLMVRKRWCRTWAFLSCNSTCGWSFEVMNGTHPGLESFNKIYTDGLEAKSKKEVTLFLNILTDFKFIFGIITSLLNASNCINSLTAAKKRGWCSKHLYKYRS